MKRNLAAAMVALSFLCTLTRAGLIHRYSFNDGTAKDSVGKVDARLHGDAKIADGKLVLNNGDKVSNDPAVSYLQFNSSVLPREGSVSLVIWITAKENPLFSRVIDFGDSDGGLGRAFIYLVARHEDGESRAGITATDTESKSMTTSHRLDDDKPRMAVLVIDGTNKKLRLHVDDTAPKSAVDLGDNTLDKVDPVSCFLGKSHFDADPGLTGSIDEFRVYDHALTPEEISALFKAGPNAMPPTTAPAGGRN